MEKSLLLSAGPFPASASLHLVLRVLRVLGGHVRSAPLLTCPPSTLSTLSTKCSDALAGKGPALNNNDFSMVPLLEKGVVDATVASSSQLLVPAGREIAFAGLYWAASGVSPTVQPVTARLAGPGQELATVTGSLVARSGG